MKAVAAALVLIAGAAVVLWYGNNLNSWVLGGLIGGLAALLLSIPISLTLFSYLSRRHEERLRAEIEEEMSLAQEAQVYDYAQLPQQVNGQAYAISEEYSPASPSRQDWYEEEEEYQDYPQGYQARDVRHLPVPMPQRAYEEAQRLPAARRGTYLPEKVQQQPRARRAGRHVNYPGFYGYTASLSDHRKVAMRTAREEALQQYDDVEVMPTYTSRRPSAPRPSQQANNQARSRKVVDGFAQYNDYRALPPGTQDDPEYRYEPRTDRLVDRRIHTEPIRQTQTGKIVRQPRLEEQPHNPERMTGTIGQPLVRRPPYMYEDDPIRQQFAQQINAPAVRRSSRRERAIPEDEE